MAESAASEAAAQQASVIGCGGTNGQNNNDIFAADKANRKAEELMDMDENDTDLRVLKPQENHINGAQLQDSIPPKHVNTQVNGSPELPPLETNDSGAVESQQTQSQKTNSEEPMDSSPMPGTPGSSSQPVTPGNSSRPVTPGSSSRPLTPGSNSSPPMTPQTPQESGKRSDDNVQCGECSNEFKTMEEYMVHECSLAHLNKFKKLEDEAFSDGESFDGRIIYNPDGSAYIIEGESDMSDSESIFDIPQQEGSITVASRGKVNTSQVPSFPQIANAFYIQRNPAAFYNTFYMFPPEQRPRPEAPIMHSYRVYDVRSGKKSTSGDENQSDMQSDGLKPAKMPKLTENMSVGDVATVPTKPILMCFICKLSFGYAKSFVAHAIGEHGMSLNDEEHNIIGTKNASAIIQGVGKDKEPLMSFLEPYNQTNKKSSEEVTMPQQSAFYPSSSMYGSSINKDASTSVSYMYSNAKTTPIEQCKQGLSSREADQSLNDRSLNDSKNSDLGYDPKYANQGANNMGEQDIKVASATSSKDYCSAQDGGSQPATPYAQPAQVSSPASSRGASSSTESANISHESDKTEGSLRPRSSTPATPDSKVSVSSITSNALLHSSGILTSPQSGLTASMSAPMGLPFPGMSASQSMMSPALTSPGNIMGGHLMRAGCEDHPNGNHQGVECPKCDAILGSSRSLGGHMTMMHSRNSCKTLKCPKCNWHYKYQETLEIHMKEKHPESETQCIYCLANQPHPRLARGEVYTCGYKPYRCDVCDYSTTTKGNLSIHMQSDKHINNMQELQNGTTEIKMPPAPPPPPVSTVQPDPNLMKKNKPKPTWRCDVCNYETNVARNLRIHMTSEKHTHNMMVLQQNVKHMQRDMQFQLNQMAVLGQDPSHMATGLPPGISLAAAAAAGIPPFFDPAMFMAPFPGAMGEVPMDLTKENNMVNPAAALPLDLKNNNNEPSKIFQCSVCNVFSADSVEALHQHMQIDRTKQSNQDSITVISGTYMCNLCTYKTNLKANFQLHCKTDKHLQRLQLVNHIRDGGPQNEWRLKYMNMSNPVQLKCNACDYYTNSIHKLQLHTTNTRHEANAQLFHHLQSSESRISTEKKYYHCSLCSYSTKAKLNLIQHVRSMKHMRNESVRHMQLREQGKENEYDFEKTFCVKEYTEADGIKFDEQGMFLKMFFYHRLYIIAPYTTTAYCKLTQLP